MDRDFLADLEHWTRTDRRRALAGKWSRRIDQEHRQVYQVDGDRVTFLAARCHY